MSQFTGYPGEVDAIAETRNAREMLRQAHGAASDFLLHFERSRNGKRGGNSTNSEQDLLRAMLVFAAAGLDATIKQLVRDGLPRLIASGHAGSVQALEAFTVRKLQVRGADPDDWRGTPLGSAERPAYARPAGDPREPQPVGVAPRHFPGAGRPAEFRGLLAPTLPTVQTARPPRSVEGRSGLNFTWLAEVMVRQDPRVRLVEQWVSDLTAGSLQSVNAVLTAANAFGIKFQSLFPQKQDRDRTQLAFDARNDIIHEMDLELDGSYATARKRHQRSKGDMCAYTQCIFDVAARFLAEVEALLGGDPGA